MFAPASSKHFLDIQATTECGFTLIRIGEAIITYRQMHRTDKYSEQELIIWSVRPTGQVFFLQIKWFWVGVQLQSVKLQILRLLRARSSLTFTQL